MIEGFDYGNSPSQIEKIDFTEKTIIHTTSAGTQGIENAVNAEQILTGSLVNAKAIAHYILSQKTTTVSLVCMGLHALYPTAEDTLCAEYIKSLLEGEELDIAPQINNLRYTDGAKFFDKEQQNVFPEEDFYLCTDINKFNFVLKAEKNINNQYCIHKIDMN